MPEDITNPSEETNTRPLRILPDPEICCTKPIGSIESFATCLVDCPIACRYVMGYGKGYLCRHPKWREFVKE